ncbi:MAG TPA: periplasmic heavy metal sensor [Polyangiaceae bacterium]|jgi:Spy/CpxP family protein refolding chaperone
MLGFIIGTVCLIGLVRVLRRGRGWHGRFGYGGHGYGHGYGPTRGSGGPRWFLRSAFERLETTPGQEKAIMAALDELRENRRVVRDEAVQTRADFARAVSSGLVDDSTLEETFARHDRLLAQLRVSFVEAVKKITEALDERQRKQVADLLEGGLFNGGRWGGGPYRGGMWA